MSHVVAIQAIVNALEEHALLVATRGRLPDTCVEITDDSRRVQPGSLFIAVRGHERNGHEFLAAAAERGAGAAIVEDPARSDLPVIVVRDGRRAAAVAAAAAFGFPANALTLVACTGTNGKTTTVGMLRHLLDDRGAPAASIGTLGVLVGSAGSAFPGGDGLTTPGPVELQRLLHALRQAGVHRVAMEVSSHALHQRRVETLRFAAAVFTNISRDHLDYHGTFEAYVAAKATLVSLIAPDGTAVVNADDPAWASLPPAPRRVTFGSEGEHLTVTARGITYSPTGSAWELVTPDGVAAVELPLVGDFNVMNAVGAAATAWALGVGTATIASRLSSVPQVPGRLERIHGSPLVLRDYAHTPDALGRALDAVRPFTPGRLIVVFGCGGDRDRGKRPLMGGIAEDKADVVVVTSDNPRTEDPERILNDIEQGMRRPHERIEDRRAAIARALEIAGPRDVVVLAGKGHETYQIRGTTKLPFDEREIVQALVRGDGRQRARA